MVVEVEGTEDEAGLTINRGGVVETTEEVGVAKRVHNIVELETNEERKNALNLR